RRLLSPSLTMESNPIILTSRSIMYVYLIQFVALSSRLTHNAFSFAHCCLVNCIELNCIRILLPVLTSMTMILIPHHKTMGTTSMVLVVQVKCLPKHLTNFGEWELRTTLLLEE